MNNEELMMRGAISMLPQEDQDKIFALQTRILAIVNENGDNGFFAFTGRRKKKSPTMRSRQRTRE